MNNQSSGYPQSCRLGTLSVQQCRQHIHCPLASAVRDHVVNTTYANLSKPAPDANIVRPPRRRMTWGTCERSVEAWSGPRLDYLRFDGLAHQRRQVGAPHCGILRQPGHVHPREGHEAQLGHPFELNHDAAPGINECSVFPGHVAGEGPVRVALGKQPCLRCYVRAGWADST